MEYTAEIIRSIAEQGAMEVLSSLGLASAEITQAAALKTYGTWFRTALKEGRLSPSRCGERVKYFSVPQILALRSADLIRADAQLKSMAL